MVVAPEGDRPLRGTRPHNRRRLIIDAAAGLFYQQGYDAVGMSDIAEAVAIGPSALYRHFRGKNDLLATVIADALSQLDTALQGAGADKDLAAVLAGVVLENRGIGVLWRREARQLGTGEQQRIRTLIRNIRERLADSLRVRRPELSHREADLLAWCALGIANSVSFHSVSAPRAKFAALLRELIDVALTAPAQLPPRQLLVPQQGSRAQVRRETILDAAGMLFAQNGFTAVSIDEIGAAVGIAGPSIYNHFPAKSDILAGLMLRGNEWLWIEFNRAVADADEPGQALGRVIDSYQQFALRNPNLVSILLWELSHLPEPERRRFQDTQRAYIDEWVRLARDQHPQWVTAETRLRVHACQIMINEVAVTERLCSMAGVGRVLVGIGEELLQTGAQ